MTAPDLAEVLYERWRSSSYELKRHPEYRDAGPTLKRPFMDQAAALEPIIAATVKNAVADALIAAAEDTRARGDIGKEGGTEAEDYLLFRARKVRADEMFEFPHGASPDPRLAPAVNAFRRVMAAYGVLTSIRPVHAAMIEALAAADYATSAKPRPQAHRATADDRTFAGRKFTEDRDGFIFINHSGPCSQQDLEDLGQAVTATAERILGMAETEPSHD
jgi:hypothetical protein